MCLRGLLVTTRIPLLIMFLLILQVICIAPLNYTVHHKATLCPHDNPVKWIRLRDGSYPKVIQQNKLWLQKWPNLQNLWATRPGFSEGQAPPAQAKEGAGKWRLFHVDDAAHMWSAWQRLKHEPHMFHAKETNAPWVTVWPVLFSYYVDDSLLIAKVI